MATSEVLFAQQSAINALILYTSGIDNADDNELRSSFAEDAVFDLTKFTSLGMNYPPVHGRDVIVDFCMKSVGSPLDTSHDLTNFRVELNQGQDEAHVICYVDAYHFKKGQGLAPGAKDYYLVKSRYDATVVRTSGEWRIKHLAVEPLWTLGTPAVFGP